MALTPKQKAFCDEYLANGYNGTKAAIAAGYSPKTAFSIATENLRKPLIKEYLDEAKKKLCTSRVASAQEILEILSGFVRDDELPPNTRMKAAQMLGDHWALYTGEPEKNEKSALDKLCETINKAVEK